MNEIVKRIDELRETKGLTKKELMAKMGVPPSTVNNWFYGDVIPTFANIQTVCEALDISTEQFFSGMGTIDRKSEQEFIDYWRMMGSKEKELIRKVIETFKELRKV